MGNRLTQIATRTGDDGTTGLGDNTRVSKNSRRPHAMGDVDELNSHIGLLLCEPLPSSVRELLIDVQHQLLKAMTSQFLKLHNIPNLNKLIDIYEKDVTTNLSAGNVMFYVKEFLKLDESAISFETIPANYSGTKNGMSYVFIHVDEWLDYLNTWLNPYTKEITSADVDILYESNGQVVATSGTVQGPNKW